MEDMIILISHEIPIDLEQLEMEVESRTDCVRDPREWPSGQWSFILHPSIASRQRILDRLEEDDGAGVNAGIVAANSQGIDLSFAYANTEVLVVMRDLAQNLVDRYQPRILDSMGRDRTEECAGRVDIFFPANLPGALGAGAEG